jgi:hypothetical protein
MMPAHLGDQAPVGLTVDPTAQWIVTSGMAVVAALVTWLVLRGTRGAERRLRLLILLGGALCVVFEPFIDHLGGYWAAERGQWRVFSLYGHGIPLWVVLLYLWFHGGLTTFLLVRLRRGLTGRQVWRLYGGFFVVAFVLETPMMWATRMSEYYGTQPFFDPTWLPVPLYFTMINAAWPFAVTGGVLAALWLRRVVLVPVFMVCTAFASYSALIWPEAAALNSAAGIGWNYLGGTLSIGLVLLFIWVVSQVAPRITPVPPGERLARSTAAETVPSGQ